VQAIDPVTHGSSAYRQHANRERNDRKRSSRELRRLLCNKSDDRGKWYPFAARIDPALTGPLILQAVNHFFAKVQQQEHEEGATPILTLVHDLETRLWGPTKELKGGDTHRVLQSPFTGSDFSRIQQLLQQTKNTTRSPLITEWFLVLDEQSEQTSTAVIVNIEDGSVHSVRVAYPVSSRYLSAASVGSPSIDELIEIANEEGGGVLKD
jgi:hypothetical protein